jgi:DNA polymerase-3 subunit chi
MDTLARADVLINLDPAPPSVFSRFDRLLEIVTQDESDLVASRQRYRFYKERGYQLVTHDLLDHVQVNHSDISANRA